MSEIKNKKSGNGYLDMELLRFTTAGSVDDGKSTLIGRLLYDSKSIFEDQLQAVEAASERLGNAEVNLALLTDGLRAEREQGITIDVAYRYFATPKRKFIIADTPGHIEYTRNMVTGASTADAAIILVDARNGIIEQTKRHSYIASLLKIDYVVVAINKMDLVDFSKEVYDNIRAEYAKIADVLGLKNVFFIPISALKGDNVVNPSENTPWYQGETLLHLLENIPLKQGADEAQFRFPVQYVIRPQTAEWPDYRAYAGRISGGRIKVGDKVTILPSQTESVVSRIDEGTNQVDEARSSQSVSISLADDVDVSRGSLIVKTNELPTVSNQIELLVCWLNHRPLQLRQKYIIRHTSDELQGVVGEVEYKVNINTLENNFDDKEVKMNDIAKIKLKLSKPLAFDLYAENRTTGSLVFIDEGTNETVGAGMIVG
ncbi:sulfate adenylyltransferase subunit 1 [Bacteroidales bacterium KHT7]|jgi:sulfate adenylyltransferase subunit 1|uniref:sulfate adenylyltransferase subunit 1 n=1 Tax=unclassified Bacteroides TaxID=2646097 RepID=UPI0004E19B18|nr:MULTISPECIES: GTP-binding protein [unclassified Bacteroides]MBQ1677804.1 GTP-binding protein [Bacteroidaceae bacterium]SDG26542.1 sulfate adenylyltransferase subunit 1 [Bacteroidales bacterium KHT7]MBQ2056353.1 GTP-binding protein [Bacteroidaceae bacterium]MBQ3771052.1 GTP-binding protein [Bacteroidaceae bacterium]MBQ3875245.1 GTP-binding protein [Bacteroidaceae bacterium]